MHVPRPYPIKKNNIHTLSYYPIKINGLGEYYPIRYMIPMCNPIQLEFVKEIFFSIQCLMQILILII